MTSDKNVFLESSFKETFLLRFIYTFYKQQNSQGY